MMRRGRSRTHAGRMAVLAVVAGAWMAGGAVAGPAGASGPGGSASRPARPSEEEVHRRVVASLKLTGPQRSAVEKVLTDWRAEMTAWRAKVAPDVRRMQAHMRLVHAGSRDPNVTKAAKAAIGRYRQIKAEGYMRQTELLLRLRGVLPAEKAAEARKAMLPKSPSVLTATPFHLLAELGLTAEQRARALKIIDAAEAGPGTGDVAGAAWGRIAKDVLTEANRARLSTIQQRAAHREMAIAMVGGVRLTEEQLVKVDGIWAEARRKVAADPSARQAVYGAVRKRIIEEVLTAGQRREMEMRKAHRGAMMPGGMGGMMPPRK